MSGNRLQGQLIARDIARTHPDLAKALRSQGETLLKNGDAHEAWEKLGAAVLLDPSEVDLRKELASAKRLIQT